MDTFHTYSWLPQFVPAAPAPYSSIGDRFNGQQDWGAEVHSSMTNVLLLKCIHVLTTAGLAHECRAGGYEFDFRDWTNTTVTEKWR